MGGSNKFDEVQHAAEMAVREAFMETPAAKKAVKDVKKELKAQKAKVKRMVAKTTRGKK